MTHHILYVPGLGDHKPEIQINLLKHWRKLGVEAHFIQINWISSESFEDKFNRVLSEIDRLYALGGKISLVGVSAGGSMAINAYMERKDKISGVVFICGKLRNPEGVNRSYFRANPAFEKSIFMSGANVKNFTDADKAKMLTIRSLMDGTIPAHDSMIPGVKNITLPVIIHVPTIFFAITVFKRIVIKFLKDRAM